MKPLVHRTRAKVHIGPRGMRGWGMTPQQLASMIVTGSSGGINRRKPRRRSHTYRKRRRRRRY